MLLLNESEEFKYCLRSSRLLSTPSHMQYYGRCIYMSFILPHAGFTRSRLRTRRSGLLEPMHPGCIARPTPLVTAQRRLHPGKSWIVSIEWCVNAEMCLRSILVIFFALLFCCIISSFEDSLWCGMLTVCFARRQECAMDSSCFSRECLATCTL